MLKFPLAITGCALITPLDRIGRAEGAEGPAHGEMGTWEAIRAGRRVDSRFAAVGDEFLEGEAHWDRSIRLALAAARQAWAGREPANAETALFCGTSKGPVGTMLGALEKMRCGEGVSASEARHIMLGVGAMGAVVGEKLGIERVHTSVAACASGLMALHQAAQAIWRGDCTRAMVVAADASLHSQHPLFEASFARLGVLAPADAEGRRICEPFGEQGKGFFVSEAAAAIVLEAPGVPDAVTRGRGDAEKGTESANRRTGESANEIENQKSKIDNASPLAWLEDAWIGADGTDLIAADHRADSLRRGLVACLDESLAASPRPRVSASVPVAFVHAHATGTAHDAYEWAAIRAIAGENPAIFSSKGALGHSLGAAGLVSVALSVLCHAYGETLCGKKIAANSASLTVAQGFGGHIGVVRLRGG